MTAPDSNSSCGPPGAIQPIDRTCQLAVDGRRASRTIADWARRYELTEPEFLVLWCLRDATGVDQTTIAQWLALSAAQISATVERLRGQGDIVQQAVPSDRRRRLWQLSPAGRATLKRMLRDSLDLIGREAAA